MENIIKIFEWDIVLSDSDLKIRVIEMDCAIYLETDLFYLREFLESDVSALVSLDSDPEVMRYITDGKPNTELFWREQALPTIFGYYERFDHRLGSWILIEKKTEKFVGWFHLRPDKKQLENTKTLELGYRLRAEFWSKGIATEISKMLIAKAFNELGAEIVFAKTMLENVASAGVMKKLGMKFDTFFEEIEFPGMNKKAVKYQILKSEWEAMSGK